MQRCNSRFVSRYLNIINIFLASREFGISRNGRRHITRITHFRFRTGIEQQHITTLNHIAMVVVMQRLPVDRCDNGEGELIVIRISHFSYSSSHFAFTDSRTYGAHGSQMHVGSNHTSLFDFDNLFRSLIITLIYYAEDERHRRLFRSRHDTQPLEQFDLMFRTVSRQVMDTLAFLLCCFQIRFNFLEGTNFGDTGCFAFLLQCRLSSHPYDCIDRQFVTENDFFIIVNINNGGQTGIRKPEEIQERGILAEVIGVVCIIHSRLIVSEEKQQA